MHRTSSSRRSWLRWAVVPVLGLALASCSDSNPDKGELTEALKTSGIPADVAQCAADAIVDNLSSDELAQIVERGSGGAPADDADKTDESVDKVRDAMAKCREKLPTTTTSPDDTTTVPGTTETTVAGEGESTVTEPSDVTAATEGTGDSSSTGETTVPSTTVPADVDGTGAAFNTTSIASDE